MVGGRWAGLAAAAALLAVGCGTTSGSVRVPAAAVAPSPATAAGPEGSGGADPGAVHHHEAAVLSGADPALTPAVVPAAEPGGAAALPALPATTETAAATSSGAAASPAAADAPGGGATPGSTSSTSASSIYAETTAGKLAAAVRDVPPRVYVPNSDDATVSVIDPATFQVVDTFSTGAMPHHITPAWDLRTLYVLNTGANTITPVDPRTGRPGGPIPVTDPYNLYFTPDGGTAIVVAERYQRLDLHRPDTWELVASIPIGHAGVDHGDFSADGRFFYVSCEWSGVLAKVDLVERRVAAEAKVGVQPIDVRLAPDAAVLYVADQARHGVIVVDPGDLHEVAFLPTGRGAHGLYLSRDTTQLYVSNRLAGSVSVIDLATRQVVATWTVPGGGSPDMGGVSADGTQLWLSGRHHGEVYVFDTRTGTLAQRIRTGAGPHGLALFPQPGRFSLGHTGVYR